MNHIYEEEYMYVYEKGMQNPDSCWISSDRDVWYRNPHYSGPDQPHPEFGELSRPTRWLVVDQCMAFEAPPLNSDVSNVSNSTDYPDDIPF